MKKIGFAIWLLMIVPCFAQEAVVLRTGEVTADKLWVGAFADVVYRGDHDKRSTADGEVKDVGRNTFVIGKGFWKETIAFEKIDRMILGGSVKSIERQKELLRAISKENKAGLNSSVVVRQLLLGSGLCVGGGFLGALAGMALDADEKNEVFLDRLEGFVLGGGTGLVIGSTLGVALAGRGHFERSIWERAFIGSLVGLGVGVVVTVEASLWPALFFAPPVCATVVSWVGNSPKRKRVSFNVGLMQHGGQGVKATYHF